MNLTASGLARILRGAFAGDGIRGRIHKISIVQGGEVSIVIRCGIDEPRARQLSQGRLVELHEKEDDRVKVQQQGKGGSGQT